jgi:polysaccharide deacetylase 2 family uncharacterized protein YibQ
MVFLAGQKTGDPDKTSGQPVREPDWEESLPQRIEALTNALERLGIELPKPTEDRKGSGALRWVHRRYDVPASPEEQAASEESLASVRQVDAGVTVMSKKRFDGVDVQVGLDGLLTHTVAFRWRDQERRPQVALVVAPLGDDLRMARACVSFDAPIVIAVEPFRPFSKEVAELARMFEREILVYMPSFQAEVGSGAGETDVLRTKLTKALESVPNAVGVTGGDVGGRTDAALSGKLREETDRLGLFYVQMQSVEAKGSRPDVVMLNSEQLTEPLADQFAKLIAEARSAGAVVGIIRPSTEILSILPERLNEWRADGVEVVPVSKLVAPSGLSAR